MSPTPPSESNADNEDAAGNAGNAGDRDAPRAGETPETPIRRRIFYRRYAAPALVGVLAGFLSGLFGVGGGVLIVPGLVLVLGMAQRLAHGTSLAAILPISIAGVVGYGLHGEIDVAAAAVIALGAALGTLVGTRLLHKLSHDVLRWVFSVFLLVTAARLFLELDAQPTSHPWNAALAAGYLATGLVIGVLSGLLGVGGGIFLVPALVVLFGWDDVTAKGTSLLVVIPTAIVATQANLRRGNADLPVAVAVGLAGVVSAFAATQLAVRMPARTSLVLFAALLVVTAVRLGLQRRTKDSKESKDSAAEPPAVGPPEGVREGRS
jgi:uncharacterized membrane protein YfcA